MFKEIRKLFVRAGVILCAALAICRDEKPEEPITPKAEVFVYSEHNSKDFNEALDVINNYVRKSGDTMNGALRLSSSVSSPYPVQLGAIAGTSKALAWQCTDVNTCSAYLSYTPASGNGLLAGFTNLYSNGGFIIQTTGSSFLNSNSGSTIGFSAASGPALSSAGDTAVNIAGKTCSGGCIIYDTTALCLRSYQNGAWATGCLTTSGSLNSFWTGGNEVSTPGVFDVAFATTTASIVTIGMHYLPQVVGVGAGNVTAGIHDGTAYLCSATCACTTAVGTACSIGACASQTLGTGNKRLRVDTSACGTGPIGSLTLNYRAL